ncbi:7166_t:CDS:2, partial [Acaulospora colombiana]
PDPVDSKVLLGVENLGEEPCQANKTLHEMKVLSHLSLSPPNLYLLIIFILLLSASYLP